MHELFGSTPGFRAVYNEGEVHATGQLEPRLVVEHADRELDFKRVLGASAGWRTKCQVIHVLLSKPTTNTPIENIIKFVHDKYVKKLYANSKDSKDPLQIYKHNKTLPLQSPPQPPQPPKPNSHQHISNSANKSIKN